MWPMLAPFVPRMLRQYILQSGPPVNVLQAGGLQAADRWVAPAVGTLQRARASGCLTQLL